MYIPDGVCRPLCGREGGCLDRFIAGQRPPWQPDAIARRSVSLKRIFRTAKPAAMEASSDLIAEFLEDWWEP